MGSVGSEIEKPFRTGRSEAERAQERQTKMLKKQEKIEKQRAAEAESEVKRRQALTMGRRTGRRSLIATSETGTAATASNLGGTE